MLYAILPAAALVGIILLVAVAGIVVPALPIWLTVSHKVRRRDRRIRHERAATCYAIRGAKDDWDHLLPPDREGREFYHGGWRGWRHWHCYGGGDPFTHGPYIAMIEFELLRPVRLEHDQACPWCPRIPVTMFGADMPLIPRQVYASVPFKVHGMPPARSTRSVDPEDPTYRLGYR